MTDTTPKFVAEGTYGCVHRPSLKCDDGTPMDYTGKISKLMRKKAAAKELQEYVLVRRADPKQQYYLGEPATCPLGDDPSDAAAIEKCAIAEEVEVDPTDFSLIVMKDGGEDLAIFTRKVALGGFSPENRARVTRLLVELRRMFAGVQAFLKHGIMHHDIKAGNIMYDEAAGRCNYIDFGLMESLAETTRRAEASRYGYGMHHWSYPFEVEFLNRNMFEEMVAMTPEERIQYTHEEAQTSLKNPKHWLNTFFFQALLYTGPAKTEHYERFIVFVEQKMTKMSYETFVAKVLGTMDVYGLGMALLHVLRNVGSLMDEILRAELTRLTYRMIEPDLEERLEIDEAARLYDKMLTLAGLLGAEKEKEKRKLIRQVRVVAEEGEVAPGMGVGMGVVAPPSPLKPGSVAADIDTKIRRLMAQLPEPDARTVATIVEADPEPINPEKNLAELRAVSARAASARLAMATRAVTARLALARVAVPPAKTRRRRRCPEGTRRSKSTGRCRKVKKTPMV